MFKQKEDYEADFESDEYDEDVLHDSDEKGVNVEEREAENQRNAWLMEQAERGRARQRALMSR